MKEELGRRYGLKLATFYVKPHVEWVQPADPDEPVPMEDPATLPEF